MEKISLRYKTRSSYTEAIECTMTYAKIPFVSFDCCGDEALIVPRLSELNESHQDVVVKGVESIFLCVSRMAHTFPSNPVDAGLVHSALEGVKQLYLSELSDILSDGRRWVCDSLDSSSCADVYLFYRLQKIDVSRYPIIEKYIETHPLGMDF